MREIKGKKEREREVDTSYNIIAECSLCRSSTNDEGDEEKRLGKGRRASFSVYNRARYLNANSIALR